MHCLVQLHFTDLFDDLVVEEIMCDTCRRVCRVCRRF